MENEIRCSNCGKKCKETDTHCRYCQEPIVKTVDTYGQPIDGIELKKWEEFIGEGSSSYISKFRKSDGKNIFIGANFAALAFAQTWMLYRKMYLEALITYLIGFIIIVTGFAIADADVFTGIIILLPLVLLYRLAICVFADSLYKSHIKREISKNVPDMRKGGTSIGVAIAGTFVVSAIVSIIEFFIK